MIPESRQEQGLLPGRSVTENVSLASLGQFSRLGFVRGRAERSAVGRMLGHVDVRAPSRAAQAGTLSGGNQQKVLFARMLLCGPRVLVADEPTRGVDVGAKRAIYDLLTSLAADGLGVLLISSDVEEILGLAHRVLVMRRGKITAELSGDLTEAAILGRPSTPPKEGHHEPARRHRRGRPRWAAALPASAADGAPGPSPGADAAEGTRRPAGAARIRPPADLPARLRRAAIVSRS